MIKPSTLNYDKVSLYFLAILGFGLSFSPSVVSIALGFIALLFLLERRYKERLARLKHHPLAYISLALVLIHILGCLWTSDFDMAQETLSRTWKYLLIPFFMMYIKRENVPMLITAFLLGMVVSEIVSYAIWLGVIEPFGKANKNIPSPFMSYPYYTVYAALSAGILISYLLFDKPKTRLKLFLTYGFLTTILINLSFTGGRGGQVGFFALLFVLLLVYFRKKWLKGFVAFSLASIVLLSLAYKFVPVFQVRADKAVEEVLYFEEGLQKGSVSIRMALNINYFKAFMEAPLLGHGTGAYLDAYERVNKESEYHTNIIFQPHNMYLLMLTQFGIVGGVIFLSYFIYMFWHGWRSRDKLQAFRLAFPFFWMVVILANWYLYSHHTLYAFLYLTSVLYVKNDLPCNKNSLCKTQDKIQNEN